MKLNRNVGLLVLAAASIAVGGAVGIASAQTPAATTSTSAATTTTPPAQGQRHWHRGGHHGGMLVGMTLRATKQLNLSAEQQASIKTILSNARVQAKAAHAAGQSPVDLAALANPADPNYATALQSAKTFAANRIQQESELQGQIYNVLTADQKAQLPTVIASLKAQAQARRAAWQQQKSAG
jgi:Spy/CpxP family protein refolding chaperone